MGCRFRSVGHQKTVMYSSDTGVCGYLTRTVSIDLIDLRGDHAPTIRIPNEQVPVTPSPLLSSLRGAFVRIFRTSKQYQTSHSRTSNVSIFSRHREHD